MVNLTRRDMDMKILTTVLPLMLVSNIGAIGSGADLHEKLSIPLVVIMFVAVFVLLLIVAAAAYSFFTYIFKDKEK
jgi:hypothetical protein